MTLRDHFPEDHQWVQRTPLPVLARRARRPAPWRRRGQGRSGVGVRLWWMPGCPVPAATRRARSKPREKPRAKGAALPPFPSAPRPPDTMRIFNTKAVQPIGKSCTEIRPLGCIMARRREAAPCRDRADPACVWAWSAERHGDGDVAAPFGEAGRAQAEAERQRQRRPAPKPKAQRTPCLRMTASRDARPSGFAASSATALRVFAPAHAR